MGSKSASIEDGRCWDAILWEKLSSKSYSIRVDGRRIPVISVMYRSLL